MAIASALLVLSACGSTEEASDAGSTDATASETSAEASAEESAAEALTIGLVIPQGDKYFQGIQDGMEQAAAAEGNTIIVVNTNNDAATEATQVQNLIQRGVSAIVMQPATSSAGSIATMKSVTDAGIPLICFGNCTGEAASPDLVKGVVQSDNTALGTGTGEYAAQYINENLGGKAVIGILNCDSFEVCKLRKQGFKDALAAAGVTAEFVADQEGYLADKATPIATNMLSANPNINVMWSANEGGTIGIVTAVTQAGSAIPVFGTDISDQLAEELLNPESVLQATTGQNSIGTAESAYKQAITAIQGAVNDPFEIGVPGVTYTKSDLDAVKAYLG